MATIRKIGKVWTCRIRKKKRGIIVYDYFETGFYTKREAELHAKKIEVDYENGFIKQDNTMLFSEYFKNWVELYKIEDGKNKTNSFRYNAIEKSKSLFTTLRVKDITKDVYQKVINNLSKDLAKSTVKKYHNYFKSCLSHAVDTQIIHSNPAKNIILRGNEKNTKKADEKYISYHEALKLKESLLDDDYNPKNLGRNCAIIALETGMRFGEILGLTWDRIDFKNQTIKIDRTWDYTYKTGFLPTKTGENRKIAISNFLIDFLKVIKSEFPDNKFVISNHTDEHITNNGANKSVASACSRANIKKLTMHNLRHTHGSILLYKGISILNISKRLGHANVSITQDVYLHEIDEMKERDDKKILTGVF